MTTLIRRLLFFSCAAGLGIAGAQADPAILAKARAFVGTEADLNAVNALRFVGELTVSDTENPASADAASAKVEISFQKPDRQRITASNGTREETTALDGYDAWQRVSDTSDSAPWEVTLLGPEQIKRLRANTFENLAFYRDIERVGGRVEDRGAATVDGIACRKLAFVHGPGIVFTRSFEIATGRLVLTETESGTAIREEGEIKAGGLRFPQRIITTNALPDGSTRTIHVIFSSVEVNPVIDASIFPVPSLHD